MEYVVKSKRLCNFLYSLGFDYREVKDKNKVQDFIWLFPNNELLQEAIIYYSLHKQKMIAFKNGAIG